MEECWPLMMSWGLDGFGESSWNGLKWKKFNWFHRGGSPISTAAPSLSWWWLTKRPSRALVRRYYFRVCAKMYFFFNSTKSEESVQKFITSQTIPKHKHGGKELCSVARCSARLKHITCATYSSHDMAEASSRKKWEENLLREMKICANVENAHVYYHWTR